MRLDRLHHVTITGAARPDEIRASFLFTFGKPPQRCISLLNHDLLPLRIGNLIADAKEIGRLSDFAGVDRDDGAELHAEAHGHLDGLTGQGHTCRAVLAIRHITGFQEAESLVPLTTSDLLAILGGLGRRPLAIVAVVLDEEDRRHSWRELHDSGIPLPGLGALDQLVDLGTIGLGRCCIGCGQLLDDRLDFGRRVLDVGKDARHTIHIYLLAPAGRGRCERDISPCWA